MPEPAYTKDTLQSRLYEKDESIFKLRKLLEDERNLSRDIVRNIAMLTTGNIAPSELIEANKSISDPALASTKLTSADREISQKASETEDLPEVVIRDDSTGIYDDNWLKPKTFLAIDRAFVGKNITLTFFLPNIPGGEVKEMRVKPNFTDPLKIDVPRGRPVSFVCTIPSGFESAARIALDVEPEPRGRNDLRELGVLLLSAEPASPA